MSNSKFFRLDDLSIVDVCGGDAITILHNLTTNEVKSLVVCRGCETFVTDVRGKTLGHVLLFREIERYRMIGAPGQSQRLAAHIDRYTIREDATAEVRDNELTGFALSLSAASMIGSELSADGPSHAACRVDVEGLGEVNVYSTGWLGDASGLLLVPTSQADRLTQALLEKSLTAGEPADFHDARVIAGFPWMGIDLDESNLPQEADRDELAISFTKGCYLGQETVARLDALGQVQKKLVRWSIAGGMPHPGTPLTFNDKTVGRLTSVAASGDGGAVAIGFARRSHFEPGSTASAIIESTGAEAVATVI